jgi:hypothetical protein
VSYTDAEKLKEIEREITIRRKIYPSWIAQNRLSYATAEKQLAILQEIAEDYRTSVNQKDMFGV